jgi:hypothetical protein
MLKTEQIHELMDTIYYTGEDPVDFRPGRINGKSGLKNYEGLISKGNHWVDIAMYAEDGKPQLRSYRAEESVQTIIWFPLPEDYSLWTEPVYDPEDFAGEDEDDGPTDSENSEDPSPVAESDETTAAPRRRGRPPRRKVQ